MKRLSPFVALVALLTLAACATPGSAPTDWRQAINQFHYPPIDTTLPPPRWITLLNGVRVALIADHELPVVNVNATIRTGAIWDPTGKEGLASMTGALMREGGTTRRTPEQLDAVLEGKAIDLHVGFGDDQGSASLSTLTADLPDALSLMAEVLFTPRLDANRLELIRARMIDGVRRENDDPQEIGMRELNKKLYAGSPYGATPTVESLTAVTREEVVAMARRFVVPSNVTLGVTGDFDEATIEATLNRTFGLWPDKGHRPPLPAAPDGAEEITLWVADKETPQAVIRMGHRGLKKTDPDYHAVRVMDEILGGNGFSSRLMQSIRTDKGLAYSVWSIYAGGRWGPGRFLMGAETKVESASLVVKLLKEEMERMRAEPVSQEELAVARDSIVNSFVFIFDTPGRIMDQWMTLDYYGMPTSYLTDYRDRVEEVTVADVLRVAKKWLHPDRLTIMVVGPSATLTPALAPLGPVRQLPLTDHSVATKGGR